MGQTQATPKSLILSHFPKVKEQALSMGLGIKKGKLDTFCSVVTFLWSRLADPGVSFPGPYRQSQNHYLPNRP